MARAEAQSGVAMEIFVEENEIAPVWMVGKSRRAADNRALPSFVSQEDPGQAMGDFGGNLGRG